MIDLPVEPRSAASVTGTVFHAPVVRVPEALDRSGKKRRPRSVLFLRALTDMLSIMLAFALSYEVYVALISNGILDRFAPPPEYYAGFGLLFGAGVVAFGIFLGAYRSGSSVLQFVEVRSAVRAVWLTAMTGLAALFILKQGAEFSRFLLTLALFLSLASIVVARRAVAPLVGYLQRTRHRHRRVAIVGTGKTARLLMKKIVQSPAAGMRLVGFVDDTMSVGSRLSCRLRQGMPERFEASVLCRTWDLEELHSDLGIDLLLVALADLKRESADDVIQRADALGVEVGLVPTLGEVRADQLELEDLAAIPILKKSSGFRNRFSNRLKRLLDIGLSVPLLTLTAPIWLVSALAIRLDSPGPVLFRQVRVGLGGQEFVVLKFRTMRSDAEAFALSPTTDSDPRITRVGRWLRVFGIDELPQLLNVIRGDMSLVGPRPEMPFLVEGYSELEQSRLLVRPGITGLWQIGPDREAQIYENLEYDIYYVRNHCLLLDMMILLETLIFTASLPFSRMAGRIRRSAAGTAAARAPEALAGEDISSAGGSYLLLALDQRLRGGEGGRWAPFVVAVSDAAGGRPVRILVAPSNVPEMKRILQERIGERTFSVAGFDGAQARERGTPPDSKSRMASRNGLPIELVPYRDPGDVSAMVSSASVVITDLLHVRDQVSRNSGKRLVYVDHSGSVVWEGANGGAGDPMVDRLVAALSGNGFSPGMEQADPVN